MDQAAAGACPRGPLPSCRGCRCLRLCHRTHGAAAESPHVKGKGIRSRGALRLLLLWAGVCRPTGGKRVPACGLHPCICWHLASQATSCSLAPTQPAAKRAHVKGKRVGRLPALLRWLLCAGESSPA